MGRFEITSRHFHLNIASPKLSAPSTQIFQKNMKTALKIFANICFFCCLPSLFFHCVLAFASLSQLGEAESTWDSGKLIFEFFMAWLPWYALYWTWYEFDQLRFRSIPIRVWLGYALGIGFVAFLATKIYPSAKITAWTLILFFFCGATHLCCLLAASIRMYLNSRNIAT
ncbi:MAG: hypothetical protein V4488_06910 [Pseudomonadota bacterium]